MVRSRNDSYGEYLEHPGAYLHPSSDTFGLADRGSIEGSFLATGRALYADLLYLNAGRAAGAIGVQRYTTRARLFIRGAFFAAYSLGAISLFPFYTLTQRDARVLDDELNYETGFLSKFARQEFEGNFKIDPVKSAKLHVLALRGIFERGRVEAMPPGPYRWRLGELDHCDDCVEAARGGPYQRDAYSGLGLPELPGVPGDGRVCLGLNHCGCRIVLNSGVPLPGEDLADRLREVLLEVVHGNRPAVERT